FSVVELKRFRSICKSWRSSVPGDYAHFPNRPLFYVNQVPEISLSQWFSLVKIFLSRAAFFRVTLSSSPSQGWLIKSDADINSGKICLLEPLSRHPMTHSLTSVDLSDFTMSEIQESFALKTRGFIRVVLVKYKKGEAYHNRILGLDHYGEIKHRPWDRNKWR
ncbi:PREDICTED: putative F-box protein At1g65770, partial [Camelina sativa]